VREVNEELLVDSDLDQNDCNYSNSESEISGDNKTVRMFNMKETY
jgi:hypothetical protein